MLCVFAGNLFISRKDAKHAKNERKKICFRIEQETDVFDSAGRKIILCVAGIAAICLARRGRVGFLTAQPVGVKREFFGQIENLAADSLFDLF